MNLALGHMNLVDLAMGRADPVDPALGRVDLAVLLVISRQGGRSCRWCSSSCRWRTCSDGSSERWRVDGLSGPVHGVLFFFGVLFY
jgi:hypothetical protein